MSKFFGNLGLVLIIGFALAALIAVFPDSGYSVAPGAHVGEAKGLAISLLQWLHVFFGITWIGLLYYFNFVQTPVMPTIPAELKPGVSKYIAPKALFYFRWGAAFTVLTGLMLAWAYDEVEPVVAGGLAGFGCDVDVSGQEGAGEEDVGVLRSIRVGGAEVFAGLRDVEARAYGGPGVVGGESDLPLRAAQRVVELLSELFRLGV